MSKEKILKNVKRRAGKAALIISICIVISALSGCNTKDAEVNDITKENSEMNKQSSDEKTIEEKSAEEGQEDAQAGLESSKENAALDTNAMYQINTKEINRNQIKIKYPQLSQEGKDWETINQLILNQLEEEEIKDTLDGSSIQEEALTLELDYKVTYQSESIISILYTGNAYIEGGMHPDNMAYAVTIDLNTNKRLYLSDFAEINETFANQIINADNWSNGVSESDENTAQTISEAISENIKDYGLNNFIGYLIEESQRNFYLTQDGVGVIVQTAHVMGDYGMTEVSGHHEILNKNQYSDYLSLRNENIVFSFKTEKGKTVSVCADKENHYIIYRYGAKDKIELEFPEMNNESWKQFTYTTYYNDKTSQKTGLQSQKLQFQNGGYQYEIYKEIKTQSGDDLVGIRVKNLSNGEITDIAGDASSFIDNWYILESNDKIEKQTE